MAEGLHETLQTAKTVIETHKGFIKDAAMAANAMVAGAGYALSASNRHTAFEYIERVGLDKIVHNATLLANNPSITNATEVARQVLHNPNEVMALAAGTLALISFVGAQANTYAAYRLAFMSDEELHLT